MPLLFALWLVVAGWLPQVGAGRGVPAHERRISAIEHEVARATLPERSTADWRSPGTRAPAAGGGGEPALVAMPATGDAGRVAASASPVGEATATRVERPRRMRFPVEATAPPLPLS